MKNVIKTAAEKLTLKQAAITGFCAELTPGDSRKSFYGRCRVEFDADFKSMSLYSYNTLIAVIQKRVLHFFKANQAAKHGHPYSVTTTRHVDAFLTAAACTYTRVRVAWRNEYIAPENIGAFLRGKA